MAPSILVVGATGNTGTGVMAALPTLLKNSKSFSQHRILALTRDRNSEASQRVAATPGVEVIEKNWTEIDKAWLQQHNIVRAFIAAHNEPVQFAEEGQFLNEALRAGLQYVVRISTSAANVAPDFPAYYSYAY